MIATHKLRTVQSVRKIARDAGLSGDVDQNPGDGVTQVPPTPAECDPGCVSSNSSRAAMTVFLRALSPGTTAVAPAHSTTIYPIMNDLGIDTSDPSTFPRDSSGRVAGFNNLWIVEIDGNGRAVVREHLVLDFVLEVTEHHRLGGSAAP